MKKIAGLGVFIAAVLISVPAPGAELKIGYADLQRALNESEVGRTEKQKLRQEAERREEELTPQKQELEKLKDEIEKKGTVWNEETRKKKEQEFFAKSQEFQRRFIQSREELNRKKVEREGEILDELSRVVAELAKKYGYTYVLELSLGGILYAPPDSDITNEVIEIYNNRSKAKEEYKEEEEEEEVKEEEEEKQ